MSNLITGVNSLRACRNRIRAFSTRAGCAGGLFLAALLAALPMQAVAQTLGVSISVNPTALGEYVSITEGEDVTFTVSRTGDNSNALTVNYSIIDGGGPANLLAERTGEGDYTAIPASYEFPAGSSASHEFTVTAVDDEVYEPWQYFTLTVKGSYQYEGSTIHISDEVIVRIRENDERFLTLSPVSPSALVAHPEFMAKEGGISNDKNELTIKLNDTLPYDLHIGYTVGDDDTYTTAASAADFTMRDGTAVIKEDETLVTIDIGIVDDNRVEPTEYFTLDFSSPTKPDDPGNALGTFKTVNFKESKLPSQPLSVSIMDNDTASTGGIIYLRGEGGGGIPGFPSTRRTLKEGEKVTITAEIAGAAPTSDIQIPLKFVHFPIGEATSDDYSIPTSITILKDKRSGSVELIITDDMDDERYRELLVVEIDDMGMTTFPTGYTKGDRSKYEIIMLDNDKTPASLSGPALTALTEAAGGRTATFQLSIGRRPKAAAQETPLFTGADTNEGEAKFVFGYAGTATRGDDYNSPLEFKIPSSGALPGGCSASGEAVACTVTLTVVDDKLYEGGAGAKNSESVKIDLNAGGSSFNDGIKRASGYTPLNLTIEDDELQPMFSIADVSGPENGNLTFIVERSGAHGNDVSVTAATGDHNGGTHLAVADTDYTTNTQKLNFESGKTSKTFVVAITDDNIDEPEEETFMVTLSNPVDNQGLPNPAIKSDGKTAVGTITDDDATPSGITLSVSPTAVGEEDGETEITVTAAVNGTTRYADAKTVTVSVDGGTAISGTDYTVVDSFDITIGAGEDDASKTFTLTPKSDVLAEGNETIDVTGTLSGIAITPDEITINDDDAAPTGITLNVDTNGSTSGTPSTVAEDAGATVVTVTATVNGETRYVDAKTVAVSVADGTAASPADYAAVSGFNITIAAGAASHTGSFTVTPVDDDLDEADETIDVTGTLSGVTVADATVTLTDTDDPVSFSIADAEATEGGKVTFTVSRAGAEDNVAEVKVATAADSGDGVKAADTDDYTAIATAQTLNFAKGVTSQTVEVQTTQDDLFEPDETFRAVLSAPALGENDPGTGVSIEAGKGTAIGTIKNDDTEPSFAVADASASEGDMITFTVTRSGAMDNAVSVKWNTKADSSDGANAASTTDYTAVPTARTLTFAKSISSQTFTVATTEDNLHEDDETFLVELTEATGATIATAEATGTITNDDVAPTTLALAVDADNNTENVQSSLAENGGAKTVKVTATLGGSTQFDVDKTVTLIVGDDDDSATEGTDYTAIADITLTIPAGDQDVEHTFILTPTEDAFREDTETISFDATLTGVTVSGASITLTSDDAAPAITLTVDADKDTDNVQTSLAEDGGVKTVRVTATLDGTTRLEEAADLTLAVGKSSDTAVEGTDYTNVADRTITIGAGVASVIHDFTLTPTNDDLYEGSETISLDGTLTGVAVTDTSLTLTDDDTQPSFAVADASAAEGDAITFTVTRSGAMDNAVSVKWNTKAATGAGSASASDYSAMSTATKLDFAKGVGSQTFTVATTEDVLHEGDETFLIELTEPVGGTITDAEATGTITDDDAAPTGITLSVDTNGAEDGTPSTVAEDARATVVTVTATVNGETRYVDAKTVAVSVADDTAASPADYAAVSGFNITIAAGAASHTGSFTVTPVDDDLDEANETIDVTGTLTDITITGATVTLTDNDDPVSFSIADAEATEGGKVTFTVSRGGAEDNVAEVKVATAADSGDGVNAADTDDYTAIATAQTLNFAKGVTSQTVEVQTTQDDLFEPDETFKAELSAPALGQDDPGTGVSIESGKGTATGKIKNDDTQPSFAVADASASEGDVITFTVTRSGAMDNVVSVKWNTRAATGAGAASTSDYTENTTATQLDFAKGEGSQTFTVATTEDTLNEANETFLIELTEPVGATITDAQATGTITNDDAAPTTLTLVIDADNDTENVQSSLAENGGAKTVKVTATLGGSTQFDVDKTVTLIVGDDDDSATEGTDYTDVADVTLTIPAGDQDVEHTFTLTPTNDAFNEASETISFDATLASVTVIGASIMLTSDDDAPAITLTVDADKDTDNVQTSVAEDGGVKTVRVTATLDGTTRLEEAADLTLAVGKSSDTAVEGTDYTNVADRTITIGAGVASVIHDFTLTPTNDDLYEGSETISLDGTLTGVAVTNTSLTLTDDDAQPSFAVANASASEGDAITFTVTRSGAMDNVVSVKWNTKAATGAGAASTSDYSEMTTATKLDFAKGVGTQTFTVATTEDVLHEGNETFLVELTEPAGAIISDAQATGTITDDDAAPSGITLSVDTNGSTSGTPSTVAEDAGATVVTVTATVNGETRYVDAKTVAVSVADGTAASPADYAAVSGFNITIAAGAASHTGSFTVTPVDDDLDEADETIDVTGTLSGVTVADATVTLTDTDDPVSFSIADAEATEGGKVTFTVSRAGAEDNVAEVKVATAADSGDGVKAAGTSDYTAIATAQTLNFAKGVTSQTVEVQTTQDDLFEPDETFRAVLSAPALGENDPGTGVSIEAGKGTAIGTIKNDDTEPSFAVADASASEGDMITFTVTRSGAMDNAVSVKWNTKADSSDGANAASTTDYTAVPTARTLTFAKSISSQTFTVATTEDVLDEENETFLVELTGAVGATIATAEATGTINDDDAAPSGITLTVSPSAVGERDGETEITVTATVNGTTRYVDAKTVTVSVGGGSATSDTDYDAVASFDITIAAGDASKAGTFDLTPTDDDLHEGNETIDVTGTSNALTITKASLTLTDDDTQPSFAVADASASEGDVITFTVTRSGAMDNVVSVKWNTRAATGAGAASTSDYTENTTATQLDFAKGEGSQTFTVATTEDTLNEANETFLIELTEPVGATITDAQATGTITNDDAAPTTLTLVIDADNDTENVQSSLAENGGAKTVKVTATLGGSTQFDVDKTVTLIVGDDDDSATEGTDYTDVADVTLTIPAGDQDVEHTFTLTPTNDAFNEASETISFDATLASVTVIGASIMLTSDDDAPAITLTVDADKDTDNVQTSVAEDGGVKTVRVTATLDGTTRLEEAADLTLAVGKSSDTAVEGTDYTNVADRTITIGAGVASVIHDFTLTPTNDDLYEGSETISLDGTLTGVAVTNTSLTLTDDDAQPSFAVANASASEGDAITFTVTRSGAMDNVVSVKWNTKAATGAGAASTSDYSEMTTATKLDFAKGVGTQTFTVATTEDVLHEGNETFLVELTEPAGAIISDAQATGTITDDDAAPSGITLSVDTNGSTSGTPSTVAEDAGATVVTVTATVNGETRYVDAKTVAVSVADGTAASPADYAAVSGFNITIAAGAASHTGSFTVTPVDDDLDEADETIDVTGTLSGVTVADATVTLTDTDDPVSFSIADAEATEGGKVTFTVSRAGAEDNVAEVKVATAADSGDGVKAAGTSDYTAIATAQTLNFAKGVTSQTVEVQTTQDDLFEPDETFRAVLSAPALGENDPGTGVSIEAGKGTAIGTIKNDDTEPSFAVADASASEGDMITFTVTRSGAMDNAVSVKWNTKADSSDGANAASTTDYTAVPTARTLTFAKSISSQTFTVATTEDNLHEDDETFLVELTEATGATIATAEATGTITDDDAAPTALTLSVDADTSTDGTQTTIAEDGGAKTVRVTATLGGASTFTEAKTVTLEVGVTADSATEETDYAEVTTRSITINAGTSSGYVDFTLTPTDDTLHEGSETISLNGTLTGLTVTDASITLTDDDGPPSALTLSVDADTGTNNVQTSLAENGGAKTVRVTATLGGSSTFTETKTVTLEVGADTDSANEGTDYTEVSTRSITINAGASSGHVDFTLTPIDDTRHETSETISLDGTLDGVTVTDASLLLTDNDAAPTTLTLAVDADNNTENVQSSLAENGGAKTVKVTATLGGSTQFDVDKTLTLIVGDDDDSATEGTDYTAIADITLTIPAGDQDVEHTFILTPTDDAFREDTETISFDATLAGVTVSGASITLTSDDAAPAITLTVDADKDTDTVQTSVAEDGGVKTVRVTATLDGTTRLEEAADLILAVGKSSDTAVEGTDYTNVADRTITIGAGVASVIHDFTLTPTNDDLYIPDDHGRRGQAHGDAGVDANLYRRERGWQRQHGNGNPVR